jgi:F0F1-type ATP synthase beta subunit
VSTVAGSVLRLRLSDVRPANFFAQPFFCAEPWTKRAGSHVSLKDSLRACTEILDGLHDDLPVDVFYFSGSLDEIHGRSLG